MVLELLAEGRAVDAAVEVRCDQLEEAIAMAKRAGSTTTSIKSSHVPMLSHPDDVAKMILAAAAAKK